MPFDHIIITTQDFPPSAGGIQTWCVELATNFSLMGYKVTVITKSFDNFVEEPFICDNVKVIRLPHEQWKREKNTLIYNCLKEIDTNKSILLASNWKMGLPVYLYNLLHKLTYFAVCHGLDALEHRTVNKFLQKRTFSKSKGAVAVSKYTKQFMKENNIRSQVDVINNGVDLNKFFRVDTDEQLRNKYEYENEKFNIVNVGRLEERKGYDKTIEAIADLPNVVFHIGGKGKYEQKLKDLVDELSLQDRVKFHGFIPDEDLNAIFSMSDLFVMPSRNVNDSVEGFGITYLEAAACGTPSIGGLNTGAEDAIEQGKSGLLVDGEKPADIRSAIEELKNNPEKLSQMGNYAAERVKNFTWDKIAKQYIDFFNEKS